ncbi:hypothetical protein BH09BAC6_BH09BAC6_33520 [soil metagenome]|jgi:hypothetical protein
MTAGNKQTLFKNVKHRLQSASAADMQVVAYAFTWTIITRFCMVFLPFKFYKKFLGIEQSAVQVLADDAALTDAKHVRQLVLAVCRHTPWQSECLVQAVVCKRLLNKRGIHTTLYLGVASEDNKTKLKAHAWLTLGETILTGARGHKQFKVVNFYG